MNFLIDILHPAHVHFFRNAYFELIQRGHNVVVTARQKECSLELLEAYKIPYVLISRQQKGPLRLGLELLVRTARLWKIARQHKADILMGIMGPSIALAGKFLASKTIVFYDTEMATVTNSFVYPLADQVCLPDCYEGPRPRHQISYKGYHELAYLHPQRFTPRWNEVLAVIPQLKRPYFLVRFVSWQASHDLLEAGFSLEQKRELVHILQSYGQVLITSEAPLPEDLELLRCRIPAEKMHQVLAHAQLLVGESATMCSEASVLGVPSIFVSKSSRGYINDQQRRYGIVRHFGSNEGSLALDTLRRWLADPDFHNKIQEQQKKLLDEHLDVTQWMVEYLESLAQT